MYIYFLWLHMYVVHILMNVIFQHTIFAKHFLNVGHLAIQVNTLGNWKLFLWMLTCLSMWWEDQLYPNNTITVQNYHFYTIWGYQKPSKTTWTCTLKACHRYGTLSGTLWSRTYFINTISWRCKLLSTSHQFSNKVLHFYYML